MVKVCLLYKFKNKQGARDLTNKEKVLGQIKELLEILKQRLEEDILPEEPEYNEIKKIFMHHKKALDIYAGLEPQEQPATRHWERALKMARNLGAGDLVRCLEALTPYLYWMVNPGYRGQNVSKEFVDNYACFELIGPDGLFTSSTVTVGVMLLSPNIYYPPHSHPAPECLYLLSGRGTWHIASGPIISIPPGGHILIPSECLHAFWSMDTPLAAIYLCLGHENQHEHSGINLDTQEV